MIRPEYITDDIQPHFPSRIALQLPNEKTSNFILGENGAEKLKKHGSMLYKKKKGNLLKLQGDYLSEEKVEYIFINLS